MYNTADYKLLSESTDNSKSAPILDLRAILHIIPSIFIHNICETMKKALLVVICAASIFVA